MPIAFQAKDSHMLMLIFIKTNTLMTIISNIVKKENIYWLSLVNYVYEFSFRLEPLRQVKIGIVDNNIAEIAALMAIFPGIKVYLCDFHRGQSWFWQALFVSK